MRRRGLSLVELVVCVALLGLVVGFVVNLIPAGTLGLQRATDVSAATAYGLETDDSATQTPLPANAPMQVDVDRIVHLGNSDFHLVRSWYPTDSGQMFDVVVTLQGPRGAPVTLGMRVPAKTR
jgi:prepilin-type N-terminal cleavage/methylation domain-containing protein